VRRVDGRSIGRFLAEEVSGPLGLDLWMGIPPEVEPRVATSVPYDISQAPPEYLAQLTDPAMPIAQVFGNTGGWIGGWDHPDIHAAEVPAMGAITNARGLCGVYTPLSVGGEHGGVRLAGPETLAGMRTTQSATDRDHVLGCRTTYTMGLSKSWVAPMPDGSPGGVCIGEDAFGTPGFGGQIGFADPGCGLAFAYTMNRHGAGTALNERGQSLIDVAYRLLGSPGRAGGAWLRPGE
jgi:CubicO group peptidase (beta-lactamase class C family)